MDVAVAVVDCSKGCLVSEVAYAYPIFLKNQVIALL